MKHRRMDITESLNILHRRSALDKLLFCFSDLERRDALELADKFLANGFE